MAFYKVLKSGHFSEARFNKIGDIVEIDQMAAKVAEERGFLELTTKKPTPAKVEKKEEGTEVPKLKPKPKPKAKKKK